MLIGVILLLSRFRNLPAAKEGRFGLKAAAGNWTASLDGEYRSGIQVHMNNARRILMVAIALGAIATQALARVDVVGKVRGRGIVVGG